MAVANFSCVPTLYAPKRKFIEFARPKWHNKLGEFSDPDILSWVSRLYQDKVFPTQEAFNKAYDARDVFWRNRTMVLSKEDVLNFEEEFRAGAFDESKIAAQKLMLKMLAVLETGEKTIFVY